MWPISGAIFPVLAAAVLGTDRRILRRLRAARATSPGEAVVITSGSPLMRWRLGRLAGAGALHSVEHDRYYLDEEGWRRFRQRRRLRALRIIGVALVLAALFYLWRTRAG
jgi:hypothetical protein